MKKPDYQNPESLVLRFMREKRKLTLLHVGKKIEIKPKIIDHIESGRKIVTKEQILSFLECYNFSLDYFNEMTKIHPLTKQAANHYFLLNT